MNYRLGLYEKSMPGTLSMREKLEHAKKAGFDYLEISVDETDEKMARLDMSQAEIDEWLRLTRETGTPIVSMCLSALRKYPLGHLDPEMNKRTFELLGKALDFAVKFSLRQVQIPAYDVYYEDSTPETRARYEKNVYRAAEMAAERGVLLAFETMEPPFQNRVGKVMRYVGMVNSPYLQIYPDLGNVTCGCKSDGLEVPDDLESGRGHLTALHLKETLPGVFRELRYGTGHVAFAPAIKKALELGVRMFVGEFWYVGNDDWEEQLRWSNNYLRSQFPKTEEVL